MANRSAFPTSIDAFIEHVDISSNDLINVNRRKDLINKANKTSEEIAELNNLTLLLRNKLFSAEDLNKLQDAMVNIEIFTKDTIATYYAYKSVYDNSVLYKTFNTINYNGNIYLALKDTQSNLPTDTNFWLQISGKGDKGDKGDPGIGLTFIGNYDNARAYNIDDAVRYNNKIYYCISSTIGNLPTNVTYWIEFLSQLSNALDIIIADVGGYFTANNVEDSLQEVGVKLNKIGDTATLTTIDKTNLVNAVNEVVIGVNTKVNLTEFNIHKAEVTSNIQNIEASNSEVTGTKKSDVLCWNGQCVYAKTAIASTVILSSVVIDTLRFHQYTLVVRLKSANNTLTTDAIKVDVLKNIGGTFQSINSRMIKANEFLDTTNYKCFYIPFEYTGTKAVDNQLRVVITLQQQASPYEVSLDSITIASTTLGVFSV